MKSYINKVFLGRTEEELKTHIVVASIGNTAYAVKAGITDWKMKARNCERFRTLLRQTKTAKRPKGWISQ